MLSKVLPFAQEARSQTIAVVNQDYAWGRDSWRLFSTAFKPSNPDVQSLLNFFRNSVPLTFDRNRLQGLRPDVILSTCGAAISTRLCDKPTNAV
jgi:hypothetical protein